MAYFKKRRFRKRAPRRYKKSKMSFSSSQMKMIKTLALNTVNKTRELKTRNFAADNQLVTLGGSKLIVTNNSPNSYVMNYMPVGNTYKTRQGNQINPIRFTLQGYGKIRGNADLSYLTSANQIFCRTVVGYANADILQDIEGSIANVPWFWNGQEVVAAGNYKDILRKFNYSVFRPFYDKTKALSPSAFVTDGSTTETVESLTPQMKDHYQININHKFKRGTELTNDTTENDCWNKNNIICLVFCRTMSDDLTPATINLHVWLEGNLYYHDA